MFFCVHAFLIYIYDVRLQGPFFVFLLPFSLVCKRYIKGCQVASPLLLTTYTYGLHHFTIPPTHVRPSHGHMGSVDQFVQPGGPLIWRGPSLPGAEPPTVPSRSSMLASEAESTEQLS